MSTDATDDLRLLLQITDSVFPTGAYAHSFGLETYVQEGAVADGTGARSFVAHSIAYPLAFTELLSMRLAYEAMAEGDLTAKIEAQSKDEPRSASSCSTSGAGLAFTA